MAITLQEQIAIEEVSPGYYISKTFAERMGNVLPIAYGGCTIGIATHAAYATVPPSHTLYSLVGHFLGPASTTEKYHCAVHTTRNTKTFATRRVEVSQIQPDGKKRVCMELLADFQVEEPALFTYSAPPLQKYSGPDQSQTTNTLAEAAVAEGKMTQARADAFRRTFMLMERYFDTRHCPEGVSGQNLLGNLKANATTQDHLPITEKTSGDWVRTLAPLPTPGERAAAVAFLLDGAVSFVPLTHNHMWLDDAGACSTLDFAMRVFTPDIKTDRWHLREKTTTAAGSGRTYSEARLWDEKGIIVASMSQQCIMRPKPAAKVRAAL
jgi:acyl-CoA thioesterase II